MTKWLCSLGCALAVSTAPVQAMNMTKHNASGGCGSLVKQAHPDLSEKARGAEIRKCKGDPDAYSKAAGF